MGIVPVFADRNGSKFSQGHISSDILPCSLSERVSNPLDPGRFSREEDDVEPARAIDAVARQIMSRRDEHFLSFGGGDASGGAAEGIGLAGADFDKHRRRATSRDDVYFPEPAAVVARDDPKSARFQERRGERLGGVTAAHGPRP